MRTNIPDIFACGDCAEYNGIVYGLWQPSREQGIVCGNTLLGKESTFSGTVPSVRLKVAGIELASIGTIEAKEGIEDVCEKNGQQDGYKKLFMRDGKIVGAILIGNVKEAVQLQKTIASQGYD